MNIVRASFKKGWRKGSRKPDRRSEEPRTFGINVRRGRCLRCVSAAKRPVPAALGTATIGFLCLELSLAPSAWAATAQPSSSSSSSGVSLNRSRAISTYKALQKYLYIPQYSLYQSSNTSSLFSYLWPLTNATAATDYLAAMPKGGTRFKKDLAARYKGFLHYYDTAEVTPSGIPQPPAFASAVEAPLGSGGSTFYDDNAWVSLDLLKQYNITKNPEYLSRAEAEFRYVVTGWDTNPNDACPGGVFWVDASWNRDRNTVSNAPNAEAGLRLYQATGNAFYLDWAVRMYNWVNTCLQAPTGMYYDHLNTAGTVNTALWSYNQGTMIGAGALLYEITGNQTYLSNAEKTASASMQYYATGSNLYQQPAKFNAIFFRNLLFLAEISPNSSYRQMASTYANTIWGRNRTTTGLFNFPSSGTSLVNQTAPMVEIFSLLGGAPPFAEVTVPKPHQGSPMKIGPLPAVVSHGHPLGRTHVTGVAPRHVHS